MLTKNQLGFLYMFLSVCTFSVMDLLVKWSSDYPTGEVLFFRGFFGLLPTYFLIPKNKLKTFYTTERSKEHLFRCLMGLMALIAIVIALRELPLAVDPSKLIFNAFVDPVILPIPFTNPVP